MPQAFSHEILSGSTNGLAIKVTGTGTAGAVTVHTAVSGTTSRDEVWLWAVNNDADGETRTLTIEFGGTSDPDNLSSCRSRARLAPFSLCLVCRCGTRWWSRRSRMRRTTCRCTATSTG